MRSADAPRADYNVSADPLVAQEFGLGLNPDVEAALT